MSDPGRGAGDGAHETAQAARTDRVGDAPREAEIVLRDMELEDIAPTFHLGEQLFTADRWPTLYRTWDEYELVNLFATDGGTCLVADRDGDIVGFALGTMLEKRRGPWSYGYLLWLGVDPGLGRRGLGRRLVRELNRRFIASGARMVLVDTETDNERALGLFRSMGFGQERPHVYLSLNLTGDPEYIRHRRGQSGEGE